MKEHLPTKIVIDNSPLRFQINQSGPTNEHRISQFGHNEGIENEFDPLICIRRFHNDRHHDASQCALAGTPQQLHDLSGIVQIEFWSVGKWDRIIEFLLLESNEMESCLPY